MLKSLLDRLWSAAMRGTCISPFSLPNGRPEAQPFGASMFFLLAEIQIARNCGTSFLRLQSPCTPNLPPYSEFGHLQPPSAFRDHGPILFSNIQV